MLAAAVAVLLLAHLEEQEELEVEELVQLVVVLMEALERPIPAAEAAALDKLLEPGAVVVAGVLEL
jgi:hypothetical protein